MRGRSESNDLHTAEEADIGLCEVRRMEQWAPGTTACLACQGPALRLPSLRRADEVVRVRGRLGRLVRIQLRRKRLTQNSHVTQLPNPITHFHLTYHATPHLPPPRPWSLHLTVSRSGRCTGPASVSLGQFHTLSPCFISP